MYICKYPQILFTCRTPNPHTVARLQLLYAVFLLFLFFFFVCVCMCVRDSVCGLEISFSGSTPNPRTG